MFKIAPASPVAQPATAKAGTNTSGAGGLYLSDACGLTAPELAAVHQRKIVLERSGTGAELAEHV